MSRRSREALAYLDRCPQKQRPATGATRFDPVELEARWGDWDRGEFTAESGKHVSVWVKRQPG